MSMDPDTKGDGVKHAEVVEEDSDKIVIEGKSLDIITKAVSADDPFDRPAAEIKKLGGLSEDRKRLINNELRKFRRGKSDSESKAIDGEEVNGYSAFDCMRPPYNLEYLAKLFDKNSVHSSSVEAKVANMVGLGYELVEST